MGNTLKKRPNIKDVAAAAGTSQTTVSRVLNNTGYPVKEDLRQRIVKAARDLNYSPNTLGRMLKHNENRELGIIIPTIVNPFYTQIVLGMETEARKNEYGVLLCNTLRSAKVEEDSIRSLFEKCIMGIALASVTEDHNLLGELQEMGLKAVAIDQEITDVEACANVRFDYLRAGVLAAEKLIATGHRNMAYLSSPLRRRSRMELLEGFRLGHSLSGRFLPPQNILIDEAEKESTDDIYELVCGRRLAYRLLQMGYRPDGIFVTNDMIAIGVAAALQENGLRVPEDISLVSADNITLSALASPPLTTIEQPAYEMGRLACRMLMDMLEGHGLQSLSVTLQPKLVERGSVRSR